MTDGARTCFRAALAQSGFSEAGEDRLALAVSGGPDSLALLALAADGLPGRVVALTVDHGLRAASADEAQLVADYCATLHVPHSILHWTGDKPRSAVQAAARAARYALMADWCRVQGIGWLATGHHLDDQAETLLMRLMRGSGAAGLSAVRRRRPLTPDVQLVRPLLGLRRTELAAVVTAQGWVPVDDPSNRDPRYARTAARQHLAAWTDTEVRGLAASADHLAAAEDALAWAAARAWDSRVMTIAKGVSIDAAGLPDEVQRRLLLRALAELAPDAAPKGVEIQRALAALQAGRRVTLAGVAMAGGAVWQLRKASPRRDRSSHPSGKIDAGRCD